MSQSNYTNSPAGRSGLSPLGILAGGSGVPCELADAVVGRGRGVHIVALQGEADPDVARFPHTWVNFGGIGAMLRAFATAGCREIVIVGRVRRPNLGAIRPDLGFWTNLPVLLRFLKGGDDAILRMVVGFFERHGLKVVGVHEAAPELVAPPGQLGQIAPTREHRSAIAINADALAALGQFDAAQAAVAGALGLAAIEGADGTDAMLRRLGAGIARRRGTNGGLVLVKLPKAGQERRIDLPAIGPETMRRAAEAGLAGVAVLAGQTLFAERAKALAIADEAGLFVLGIGQDEKLSTASARQASEVSGSLEGLIPIASRRPNASHLADAALGARVLAALGGHWTSASTVVSRGYVLATQPQGEAKGAAARAGRLKPWGMRMLRRRSGVLVMTDCDGELGFDPGDITRACAASSLAGIVVLRYPRDEAALAALRLEADRHKLFLLAPGGGR